MQSTLGPTALRSHDGESVRKEAAGDVPFFPVSRGSCSQKSNIDSWQLVDGRMV